ncbi:MAG: hypothetical protein HZB83_09295, partial [Deltaproteobacteria bacterium]|nr:hypothetical protein [Deltaproteobacteria bacterium]
MSTKNLTYNSRQFTLFFVISLVIHIALLGFFNAFGPAYGYLFDRLFQGEPLEVNVVELPPPSSPDAGIGDTQNRERMTRFAGRENRVIKETFPSRPPDKLIVKPRGGPASIAKGDAEGLKQKTTAGNGEQAAAGLKAAPDDMDGRYTSPAAGGFAGADNGKGAPAGQSQGTGGKGGAGARPFKPNLSLPDERIAELTKEYESTEQKGEKGKTLQLNTAE